MSNSATILVADDERNIRLMIRRALETEGHAVDDAADGAAAVEAVERGAYDLLILDLNMPHLDGMGVLQRLAEAKLERRPRVLVLTAYGSVPAAVRATRLGALDFLEKPITPEELRTTVEAVLREPQPACESEPEPAEGYAGTLVRVCAALRESKVASAESLLIKAADLGEHDAAYFNLLGVIYELRRQWRLARKFYGKAARADRRFEPAQQNLRRLYELESFGHSGIGVALGDGLDALRALGGMEGTRPRGREGGMQERK